MIAQILDAHEVDLPRHVTALRRAFHGSPWVGEIGATLTPNFYRWKYNTPAGEAKLAYVISDVEPVSGVSAFPMIFELPNHGVTRGWQIGDIMTAPERRGRGLYGKCLSAITEHLKDDLLICFPNDQSRRAIERSGFVPVAKVETFVRPILIPLTQTGVTGADRLRLCDIAGQASAISQCASVRRDQKYLEWRYARHPVFSYEIVGGPEGFAVMRSFRLFGIKVAVVMEFHPAEGSCSPLLEKVHHWTRENGMMASFLMGSSFPMRPMRFGYIYIPPAVMPKRQVLYARYPRGQAVRVDWRTQIGDWDGL